MDFTRQTQSGTPSLKRPPIDSDAKKSLTAPAQPAKNTQPTKNAQPAKNTQPTKNAQPTGPLQPTPTPVTSAKAAINAMRTAQADKTPSVIVTSAREAVNAAAKQDGVQFTKSAANLHHGSIQRSMESTRTSASALLRRAGEKTEIKIDSHAGSVDPLAKKIQLAPPTKRPEREIPVVRTSLKLGASARPKPAPVVLPPGARMAKVARPVESAVETRKSGKIAKFLRLGAADVGSASTPDIALKTPAVALKTPADRRKMNAVRDPQMLAGARRSMRSRTKPENLASRAKTAEVLGMATTGASRFRMKPKGYTSSEPSALPTDNSYIMAEPPKLSAKKKSTPEDLGVIESYSPANPPQPISPPRYANPPQPMTPPRPAVGDRAPTGNLQAAKVASGSVAAPEAPELPAIKAENTSNYSFSRRKSELADKNRYAPGGESPFLKSVSVEKRPLSANPQKFNPSIPRVAIPRPSESAKSDPKASRASRKNQYAKKTAPSPRDLPTRPTVIIPSSHRSSAPLFFLIAITVVLGFSVGAAAYLCFFQ